MAKKTNCTVNGKEYYRIYRKVGKKLNKEGLWVDDRKAFYGSCKSEAEAKYNEYMKGQAHGNQATKCLGELIDDWKDNVFKSMDYANSTKVKYIRAYEKILQNHRLAGLPASNVTAMDLQTLYNESDACEGTITALHNFLRLFYSYAELNNWCRNITYSLSVPKKAVSKRNTNDVEVWDDESLQALIEELRGGPYCFLIILAANTGLRIGELLALTYDDIRGNMLLVDKQLSEIAPLDSDSGKQYEFHITHPKTSNSNRVVPLSSAVLEELEKHKAWQKEQMKIYGYKTNYLFTTSKGTFYYQRNLRRALERACKRINGDFHSVHVLRHTFGTNLSRSDINTEVSSKLMGHSDVTITSKYYVNVDAERKLDAVEKISKYSLGNRIEEE